MQSRIDKVRQILKDYSLDAILVSSPAHVTYLTNFNHFTPLEREAFLIISNKNQYIITDGRYSEAVIEKIPHFKLLEISSQNRLENILKNLAEKVKLFGFEPNNLTVSEYSLLKKGFKLKPVDLRKLRATKDKKEITALEKACKLGDEAFKHASTKLKLNVTEKEIALEIEMFVKSHGADLSFPTIVAFGKNSSIPHHQTGNTKLKKNDFVLIDMGTKVESYCSDMTRTVVFGNATEEQKKMHQTVSEAQTKAIELLNHKSSILNPLNASEVDKAAREHIMKQGFATIPHSLGHGIGLEVHESPSLSPGSKDKLEDGMVFSIEPGIYLPGFGGVRIEDLIILEKGKPRLLTKSPRDLTEI